MRYAIYLRQSIAREGSVSIEMQEQACREAVARLDGVVAGVWWDQQSGSNSRSPDRPAYRAMLAAADAWDTLMVYRLDRAGRHELEFHRLLDDLDQRGKGFATATEDVSDPLARSIKIAIAADAARKSGRMSSDAKTKLAKDGFCPGRHPFGTIRQPDGVLVPDPATFPLVHEVLTRLASGEPYRSVARWMHAVAGAPAVVQTILTNPVYEGRIYWNGQTYPARWGPLVDLDLLARARAGRRLGRPRSAHRRDHVWIDQVGRCAVCGAGIRVAATYRMDKAGRGIRYRAHCKRSNRTDLGGGCNVWWARELRPLQACALDQIRELVVGLDLAELRAAVAEINATRLAGSDNRPALERRRVELAARLRRAEEGYLSGALSPERAKELRLSIEGAIAEVDVQLATATTPALLDADRLVARFADPSWLGWAETAAERFGSVLKELGITVLIPGTGRRCDVYWDAA